MAAKSRQQLEKPWTGERILKLRTKLKLTQVAFAVKLGVSFSSVNRWENDNNKPSQMAIRRMEELNG